MEVLELTAAQFIKAMCTGRNRPLLLGCADNNGASFEVVVKFRGREMNYNAQIAELVAAQAADDLGLQSPKAAVVDVPIGFETTIPDSELAMMVKGSAGSNFGSVHLGSGFTTWPPGRNPVGVQRDQAAEIFAFDTLVQNPIAALQIRISGRDQTGSGYSITSRPFRFWLFPSSADHPNPGISQARARVSHSSNSTSFIPACAEAA